MEYRQLIQRIREEFKETPGLRLTVLEASRFWGLDEVICESVLAKLTADGFLAQVNKRFQAYIET